MASVVSFSLHPPPMTTRQRTRNVAEPYLNQRVSSREVRAGWAPTDAVKNELIELTKLDGVKRQIRGRLLTRCNTFSGSNSVPESLSEIPVDAMRALDDEEVALLTFVQHFDFVWENDFMFVGSRKAKGFQKYERTWYKAVYRDGELRIKYSGDAGKQPCSPSIVETEIEYFWPSFNELFDMEHLRSTKCNQQDVFIAGTYLILLRYPALRKYQEPGSGLGIKLVPRLERFELPFSPASSSPEEPQPHRTRQFSSSSEPLPTSVVQSAPNDQRRQSEAGPLAEELNQRETQRKITTMSQSSGRAYAATSQVIVSYSKSVGARTEQSLDEPATIVKTPDPVQQLQNQSPVGGLLNHLLQNIQLSSFVDTFCNGTRLRIVAHLPADRFRPPALKFSPVVWMDISPIIPSRDCIIQALEKIAMSSLSAQQRAARQRGFAARPCGRASSPYRADGNSAEQVQQRQQCHR